MWRKRSRSGNKVAWMSERQEHEHAERAVDVARRQAEEHATAEILADIVDHPCTVTVLQCDPEIERICLTGSTTVEQCSFRFHAQLDRQSPQPRDHFQQRNIAEILGPTQ